jgi:hypothetical protein
MPANLPVAIESFNGKITPVICEDGGLDEV